MSPDGGSRIVGLSTLASRLRRHVETLAGDIGERHVWRPMALRAATSYVEAALRGAGLAVRAQRYAAYGIDCANLEAVIPGAAGDSPCIVVGAHYDTVAGSPGADDNASGVAALIEIARLLRDREPAIAVKCVAFVNEEPPFFYFGEMGSRVYARAARAGGVDVRVMLSLEMLGCYSDAPGSQAYPPLIGWFYPDAGRFIGFVSNLRSRRALAQTVGAFRKCCDFPAESLASPSFVPGVSWSDQLSFWRAGYPAVMVTDTAFYRYAHYHRPTDTPEKLDYARMASVTSGLASAIALLAGCGAALT